MFKPKPPPLGQLRQSYGMASLPDSIKTDAIGEYGHPISKPIGQATIDDIAFAIQSLSTESTALFRRLDALRQLHDRARRAGGLGSERAVEAALRIAEGGR
jgi:hypothetical protein